VAGLLAVAFLSALAGIYPSSSTRMEYRVSDFSGRLVGPAVVESEGSRARVEFAGDAYIFDGMRWSPDPAAKSSGSAALALTAPLTPSGPSRNDEAGRPVLLSRTPVGNRTARIELRYDGVGLLSANLVFSDGSGYKVRRISAVAAAFAPSDFEPPRQVAAEKIPERAEDRSIGPDFAAVARLLSLQISDAEQREFERQGGVGRYRAASR
jgi:hypothetical protein